MQQVQQWFIVLHLANSDTAVAPRYPIHSIKTLCRIICRRTPRAIDIAVVTKGVQRDVDDNDYDDIEAVLAPFKLLRGIEQFKLRDASPLEIPQVIEQDDETLFYESHLEDHAALEVDMMLTCTSMEPIEFAFDMHERLLRYAQAFESHEPFKLEMAMDTGARLDEDSDRSERSLLSAKFWFHHNNPLQNPYRDQQFQHPVEAGLQGAAITSENQDVDLFKLHRSTVLEYLETQYKRMAESATALVDLVHKFQRWDAFFDPEKMGRDLRPESEGEGKELLELLKQFKGTFVRDFPDEIKEHISQHQAIFDSFYASGIDWKLQQMSVKLQIKDFASFVELFRTCFDEIYTKYVCIREARQELFGADTLGQPGWELDLELGPEDAFIDWTQIYYSHNDYESNSGGRSYHSDDDGDSYHGHGDSDHEGQDEGDDDHSGDDSHSAEEDDSVHGSEDVSAPDGDLSVDDNGSLHSGEVADGPGQQSDAALERTSEHQAPDFELAVPEAVGSVVTQDEEPGPEQLDDFDVGHRVPGISSLQHVKVAKLTIQ